MPEKAVYKKLGAKICEKYKELFCPIVNLNNREQKNIKENPSPMPLAKLLKKVYTAKLIGKLILIIEVLTYQATSDSGHIIKLRIKKKKGGIIKK